MTRRTAAVITSLLILAAHFLREGRFAMVVLSVAATLLLLFPTEWARRTLQIVLVLAAGEWIRTAAVLVEERRRAGAPFLRLAIILAVVAVFTASSAALLRRDNRTRTVNDGRPRSGLPSDDPVPARKER